MNHALRKPLLSLRRERVEGWGGAVVVMEAMDGSWFSASVVGESGGDSVLLPVYGEKMPTGR
jgi:hypothetical protein